VGATSAALLNRWSAVVVRMHAARVHGAQVYDPATGSWSALPDMSTQRDGCALCVLSPHSFGVFGGCGNGSYQRDCEVYSFETGTWSSLPPVGTACASHPCGRLHRPDPSSLTYSHLLLPHLLPPPPPSPTPTSSSLTPRMAGPQLT
jgi:hypothetical protein